MPKSLSRLMLPVLLSFGAAATAAAQAHPDLAGSWELNPQKSTSPKPASGTMDRGREGGGIPRGGGGMPGSRRGGMVVPNEDEFPMPRGDAGLNELVRAKQHLEITVGGDGVTVKDDAGWARTLVPDGGRLRDEDSQGGAAAVETKWKGDRLVTERVLDRRITIKETFSMDRKSKELVVELEVRGERMARPLQMRRVYDRAP